MPIFRVLSENQLQIISEFILEEEGKYGLVFLMHMDSDSGLDTTWILTLSFLSPGLHPFPLSCYRQLYEQSWEDAMYSCTSDL